jgi:hypothetical protein
LRRRTLDTSREEKNADPLLHAHHDQGTLSTEAV